MTYLVKLVLSILSIRGISRAYGCLVRMQYPRFLVKRIIWLFKNTYQIDMDDYQGELQDYKRLSDFFNRPLNPEKRPLIPVDTSIVSPSDGKLTILETVYEDKATQIKGKTYSLSQLLGETLDFSQGWHVAVIYLSPSNYHRYHYPLNGHVSRYLHTGVRLYPVNHFGLNFVDMLFVRNERVVVEILNRQHPVYAVAVGATFVGSIKMEFMPKRHPRHSWVPVEKNIRQLEEMGRFDMGSTIVLVIPAAYAEPLPDITGQNVHVGQPLFRIC